MTTQPPDDQQPTGPDGAGYGAPNYGAPSYGESVGESYGGGFPAGTPGAVPERPASLTLAVRLMFVGAALSVLGMLTTFFMMDEMRTQVEDQLRANGDEVTEDLVNVSVAVGSGSPWWSDSSAPPCGS